MAQTSLDYDKIIWEVFAVGVVSSIVLLYYGLFGKIEGNVIKIIALSIGFAILVYSFLLILGYGFKKSKLEKIIRDYHNLNGEDNIIQRELGRVLRRSWYPRVRWMGEIILFCMILIYGFLFFNKFGLITLIPILIIFILILFTSICLLANCCARKKLERKNQKRQERGEKQEKWKSCGTYFKEYFCCKRQEED